MKKIIAVALMLFMGVWVSAQSVNITYHKNGKVKTSVFEDGSQMQRISYYKSGKIQEIANYKDGKLHGKWQEYDKRERLVSEGEYVNGMKSGIWLIYNVTNKKVYQVTYRNDVKIDSREWARTKE